MCIFAASSRLSTTSRLSTPRRMQFFLEPCFRFPFTRSWLHFFTARRQPRRRTLGRGGSFAFHKQRCLFSRRTRLCVASFDSCWSSENQKILLQPATNQFMRKSELLRRLPPATIFWVWRSVGTKRTRSRENSTDALSCSPAEQPRSHDQQLTLAGRESIPKRAIPLNTVFPISSYSFPPRLATTAKSRRPIFGRQMKILEFKPHPDLPVVKHQNADAVFFSKFTLVAGG